MIHGIILYEEFEKFRDTIDIKSVSYIGNPISNTAMFVGRKVDYLISNLHNAFNCIVFTQNGSNIPEDLKSKHLFVLCENPSFEYAYAIYLIDVLRINSVNNKYIQNENGVFIGENVKIGKNANIEPGCVIGPNVTIGNNATICSLCVIKNSVIGDNFIAREGAKIGTDGFAFAMDCDDNMYRIPFCGNVIIGHNVEIGVNSNISRSIAGSTIIGDYSKTDALVYVGHDTLIGKNVKLMAGVITPGFIDIQDYVKIAVNASIRNRITIGEKAFIGMGSTVTKSVEPGVIVVGNPAKEINQK